MYADAQATAAAAGAAGGGAEGAPEGAARAQGKQADDNVVDAEFKEVKK
jgi:molecular chaperone DnaK